MSALPRIQAHARQDSRDILTLVLDTLSGDGQEQARRTAIDRAMLADKRNDGYTQRAEAVALQHQLQLNGRRSP